MVKAVAFANIDTFLRRMALCSNQKTEAVRSLTIEDKGLGQDSEWKNNNNKGGDDEHAQESNNVGGGFRKMTVL